MVRKWPKMYKNISWNTIFLLVYVETVFETNKKVSFSQLIHFPYELRTPFFGSNASKFHVTY